MKRLLAVLLPLLLACSGLLPGKDQPQKKPQAKGPTPTTTDEDIALPPRETAAGPSACQTPTPTPRPQGCAMAAIACGGKVLGSTAAGNKSFEDDFYQAKFCTPQRHRYGEAPEAVYTIEVPGDTKATVTLTSECAELDIASLGWNNPQRCPGTAHPVPECEMDTTEGGGQVVMTTVTRPQTFLIVVDGKNGASGNFELNVKCEPYR